MSINLFPTWTLGALPLTDYPYSIEFGGDHGAPSTITELVESLLADGDIVNVSGHGNRELSLVVLVEGPTMGDLAQNEASLRRACAGRTTLAFDPGDGFSSTSVFDVLVAEMRHVRDDAQESHLLRRWELTLTCAPFARSTALTTVPALLPPPGSTTNLSIDSGASAARWTASLETGAESLPITIVEAGSYVQASGSGLAMLMRLTPAAPVNLVATPYLAIQMSFTTPTSFVLRHQVGSNPVQTGEVFPVQTRALGAGVIQYVFFTGNFGNLVTFEAQWYYGDPRSGASGATEINFAVHDVSASNVLPQDTPRQLTRLIYVGGTERTPASLHAYAADGFLGNTILHTTPYVTPGYHPALSRHRYSGNTPAANVSSRRITGTWEPLQPSSLVARFPSSEFPRGDYVLMAAVKSSATGLRAVSWVVKSLLAGNVIANLTGTSYFRFDVADRLEYVPLGVISAALVRSTGQVLDVEVHLSNPSGAVTMHAEEFWLFVDGPDSALSIVGTDEANLWLDSADVTSSVPRVWVGSPDAKFHPNGRLIAQGDHKFLPGAMQVTSISDANDNLKVDLTYFMRWHSNAAG